MEPNEVREDDDQPESNNGNYMPTPEEIAAECARIRSEWSESRLMKKLAETK